MRATQEEGVAERHVLSAPAVTMADAPIGATMTGIDVSGPISDVTFSEIEDLFNARSVLCLRGQSLTASEYMAFAARFGGIEPHFMQHYSHADHREILLISNVKENGQDIGHADAGSVWHTDMSYTDRPPRATLLYAVEVPERDGVILGDTLFASASAAYDSLPETMKTRIEDLMVVHDVFGRRAKTGTGQQDNELRKQQPNVIHPMVRTHPWTGRKCLYVSPGECIGIVGMPDDEALALIGELAALIPQPEFMYRHRWQKGDLLIWDNCAVQHLASHDYSWPEERRLMWRLNVGCGPSH